MRRKIHGTLILEVIENCVKFFIYSNALGVMVMPIASVGVRGCLRAIVYDGEAFQVNRCPCVRSSSVDRGIVIYDADSTTIRRSGIILKVIETVHHGLQQTLAQPELSI